MQPTRSGAHMNPQFAALLIAFESHSVEGVKAVLDAGFDIQDAVDGKAPLDYLIEMYFRSDAFVDCLRLLLDHGARLEDRLVRAVLLNDVTELDTTVADNSGALNHRTSLNCAFTPLSGATLLHIAAEYGHLKVARRLIELGADVNARAAVDENGFNGHTPLFHTVNSNRNRSAPVMRLLLDAGARTDVLLPGITWGRGFDWETVCFDVTPISYAQLGLLRQMQRTEVDTYENIKVLLAAAGRGFPPHLNVPNRYLAE